MAKEAKPEGASVFEVLSKINVSEHIEKKESGKDKYGNPIYLSYLSWPWAWATVKQLYPDAVYQVYHDEQHRPYVMDDDLGYMVFTTVTIADETHEMWLPVMDSNNLAMKNKPYEKVYKTYKKIIAAATMFDINTTIMRCLVKNLAMFGLGLNIYAGEDLPMGADDDDQKASKAAAPSAPKAAAQNAPKAAAKPLTQRTQELYDAEMAKKGEKPAAFDPIAFLKKIKEALNINDAQFAAYRQELIDMGAIKDIPSKDMTEADWKQLFTELGKHYGYTPF